MEYKSLFHESGYELLITQAETIQMLTNLHLHDQRAFFIVTPEGNYDDSKQFHFGIVPERIKKLEAAFNSGHTIIIKEVENWNEKIISRCQDFGRSTNVHLYLSPAHGTGFDWHTDDRDVWIYMQSGEKSLEIEAEGKVLQYRLRPGSGLHIPFGVKHRALPSHVPSIHLSFGIWPGEMTIQKQYSSFPVEVKLNSL